MFESINQGPTDTIIFHIQNEKVDVNGENFSMLFQLGDNPCKHGLLYLSWQNYHNDIDNLFKNCYNNVHLSEWGLLLCV